MPGFFGAVHVDGDVRERLVAEWRHIWPKCGVRNLGGGVIGAHALEEGHQLLALSGGCWLAVDGEASLYRAAEHGEEGLSNLIVRGTQGELELTELCRGNVALLDEARAAVELTTEWTGTFPLYFAHHRGGLLFSTALRPLARALFASPDPVGVVQFLRTGYTCGGRSLFQGIRRLQPGQSLRFGEGRLEIRENSDLWVGSAVQVGNPEEAAEQTIPLLRGALAGSVPGDARTALMMSGGWDSRTLLAVSADTLDRDLMLAYSHGDTESRELRLVRRICRDAGISLHLQEIDESIVEGRWIEEMSPRAECAIFPHWMRAGKSLAALGMDVVFSGVYGEVLGGHYGETMLRSGAGKVMSFFRSLLASGTPQAFEEGARERVQSMLRIPSLGSPWYLRRQYLAGHPDLLDRINEEAAVDLGRLERRGIDNPAALVEAFVTEHRGTQYINAQILSCRPSLDAAIPFADRELLRLVCRIPLSIRLHNQVNRCIIQRMNPTLLRPPLAATLVPAWTPILLQELSRAARKAYETTGWALHRRTGGMAPIPRLGWVNFDFLRDGRALEKLVSELQADLWDRARMGKLVSRVRAGGRSQRLHPLFDQMGKILTVDFMLR